MGLTKKKSVQKREHKGKKEVEIVGSMTFGEAISKKPSVAKVLAEEGMFCGCCPMAMMETIAQGAKGHNVDLKKLLNKINKK